MSRQAQAITAQRMKCSAPSTYTDLTVALQTHVDEPLGIGFARPELGFQEESQG